MLLQQYSEYVDKEHADDWWTHLEHGYVEHTWQGPKQYNNWYWMDPDPIDMCANVLEMLLSPRFDTDGCTEDELCSMHRAVRFDRPYYPHCDIKELQSFVRARKLLPKHVVTTSAPKLIKILQKADQKPRFCRFIDLPKELRAMVYKEYLIPTVHGRRIFAPAQPPITMVSSRIRQESLPLFYNLACFGITLLCGGRVRTVEEARHERVINHDPEIPVSGHCHLDHHFLETGSENEYLTFHGIRSWAFIPNHMVDWFSNVYPKYVKEIRNIEIFFPHMCLDLNIGWDKKTDKITFFTHGHCEQVHDDHCKDKAVDQRIFDKLMTRERDTPCISIDVLKQVFIELDERNKIV